MCLHGSVSLTSQVICDTQEVTIPVCSSSASARNGPHVVSPKRSYKDPVSPDHLIKEVTHSKPRVPKSNGVSLGNARRARDMRLALILHLVLGTATADSCTDRDIGLSPDVRQNKPSNASVLTPAEPRGLGCCHSLQRYHLNGRSAPPHEG